MMWLWGSYILNQYRGLHGWRIVGPTVECGELNTIPMTVATNKMSDAGSQTDPSGDSEGCLSGRKQEHTVMCSWYHLLNS